MFYIEIIFSGYRGAHCDITGNQHADFFAKKGALVIQIPPRISIFNSLRIFSNMVFEYNFKIEAVCGYASKDKNWAILSPCWAPRKASVAQSRLLTGHDCLIFHLYRIGITDLPDSSHDHRTFGRVSCTN
ncbi:hypothetical protein TNCV_244301 [Trichonephila clavipes]|uniref:Uncharacterized protein n=1 Tax=Trichonephila clavipes TaxID=2585209 RepID=A0A8X6V2C0_TRICX|nr:hypothetical protein TNCV_244301 [Trichonephila clavipes]